MSHDQPRNRTIDGRMYRLLLPVMIVAVFILGLAVSLFDTPPLLALPIAVLPAVVLRRVVVHD